MKMYSLGSSFLLIFCFSLWNGYSGEAIKLPGNMTIPAVFAFGDSIVDQGNNNNLSSMLKCNFAPYGADFSGGVSTGRFSNAKTPPDLIAEELGIRGVIPAYLDPQLKSSDLPTGVSFASGGSGYDPQTPKLVSVTPLPQQLEYFKEYIAKLKGVVGEEKAKFILANGLFLVVAGSDDVANTYYTFSLRRIQYDINSYADLMVSSASSFYQELFKLGARRVAVFGVPPVGCVPFQRTLGGGLLRLCAENLNQLAQTVNAKLSKQIDVLTKSYPDSRIRYIDVYTSLYDIIQHPQNYGFEVVDNGCCGTGALEVAYMCNKYATTCANHTNHLFWDSYHPTERGYRVLVQGLVDNYIPSFA